MAVESRINGLNRRTDADGSEAAREKRPWQFSLRTLFIVTLVFAAFCSFLKVVPTPLLLTMVLILYVAAIVVAAFIAVAIVAVAIVCSVFPPLTDRVERCVSRLSERARPSDAERHGGEPGSTAP